MPYTMPKFTALAAERWAWVTCSGGMPSTWAAVAVWISSPVRNASCMALSPEIWASSRSSIWE